MTERIDDATVARVARLMGEYRNMLDAARRTHDAKEARSLRASAGALRGALRHLNEHFWARNGFDVRELEAIVG